MELYGSITYDAATNSYDVYHNSSDGWEVHMPIKIQKDSKTGGTFLCAAFPARASPTLN